MWAVPAGNFTISLATGNRPGAKGRRPATEVTHRPHTTTGGMVCGTVHVTTIKPALGGFSTFEFQGRPPVG